MLMRNRWFGRLLLTLLVLAPTASVQAGGLYLFDRGARPLSRGGAFVAGADDPGALWYNPAGLAASGNQVLLDATLTVFSGSFNRVDAAGLPQGKVEADPTLIPIPTAAISHNFGLEDWTFGAGIFAPNVVLMNWPQTLQTSNGVVPAGSRYSLIGLEGSLLSSLTLGLAYHGIEGLSIGADVQVVAGHFKAKTAMSACDAFACSNPEDPAFDTVAMLDLFPAVGISGAFGFTYDLLDMLRIGGSVTLPYTLEGDAKLDISLPSSPLFENANIRGDKAHMALKFPWIYRVGAELRPTEWLRMEGTFVYEGWSRQKDIPITPKGIQMQNIRGIGDYDVGPMAIQRKMRDTWSLRGGFEAELPEDWFSWDIKVTLRGGLAYERGAFTSKTLTPMTVDTNKVVLTGGLGINLTETVRMDGAAGWIFMADPKVRNSEIKAPDAIRPSAGISQPIGNGNYTAEAFYIGGGFSFMLE